MTKPSSLPGAQQENVLCLMCFDRDAAPQIISVVTPELFGSSVYRSIAEQAINFFEEYGDVVGDHLPDVLDHFLNGKDSRRAQLYERTLLSMYSLKDRINSKYVLGTLRDFVRVQNMKQAITDAARQLQSGEVENAESTMLSALKYEVSSFDAGLFLSNVDQFLGKLHEDIETMPTGIVELDRVQSGPARAELHVFLAPTNRGKSWWLMHLAKHALMQRFRVLHVSLEMSIQRCAIRYVQTLFSISKREAEVRVPELEVENNTVAAIGYRTMKRPTLNDPDIRPLIAGKMKKMGRRLKLVIQEFATGSLTITGLQVYLDRLERMHKFVPDLILVDYADNMKLNTDNYRLDLGALYKNLRRIAVERNCAVATASQSNRAGEDARFITLKHLGEDYSKAQTADVVISYNQTQQERELGLARLFVAKSRNDEAGGTVLIAQGYAVGQFCVQSSMISPARYWDLVDGFSGKKDTDDED